MWDNPEDAFKELDQKEFAPIASTLAALRDSLLAVEFTREETMFMVTKFSKLMFDMTFEDYVATRQREEEDMLDEEINFEPDFELDDDVDSEEEDL